MRSEMADAQMNYSDMSRMQYYGSSPSQFLKILYPSTPKGLHPVAIIIHGGFWKSKYGISPPTAACETLAPDLQDHQFIVVEVEYRRDGDEHWGWPYSNNDVTEAYKAATCLPHVDRSRIYLIGHSAGGTLALWLAARLSRLRDAALPRHVLALAPVADLREAVNLRLSDEGDAVIRYMHGTPKDKSSQYDDACPTCAASQLVGANITLVAGTNDTDVPLAIVKRLYQAIEDVAARESCTERGHLDFLTLPETDHFDLVHAGTGAWRIIREKILQNSRSPVKVSEPEQEELTGE